MAFLKSYRRVILQALFALLFIGLAIFFITHERAEVHNVKITLENSNPLWVLTGIIFTCIFITMQGLMYYVSFRTVGKKIALRTAIKVYLKRNFIGVFLPAGGVASLAFFTRDFERHNISRTKIHFASSIYAFTGALTVVLISIPVLLWALLQNNISSNQVWAFSAVFVFVGVLIAIFISIIRQGTFYRLVIKMAPSFEAFLFELKSITIKRRFYASTVVSSLIIELIGITHLIIASRALGFHISLETAAIGYVTSVLFLVISPFLRGLGAVELSLAFILTRFGFTTVDAISITLLYRFFEFWIPLVIGGLSFMFVRNNLVLRVIPAILTFTLGIINIISVLTPASQSRLNLLLQFLPLNAIHVSNYFVLTAGLFLLVISAFLLRGHKTIWFLALLLALFSLVGHLTKAIDYEEAMVAAFVVLALVITRKQYFVKFHPRWGQIGIATAVISMVCVLIYGIFGFYFLDKRYFNIDFSLVQAVKYSFENFFLFRSDELQTTHHFARNFLYSINIAGFLSMSFLLYTLVRPYVYKPGLDEEERKKALELVKKYGRSGLDYFKTYPDKLILFSAEKDGFLSYRTSGNYAVVLEDPVSSGEEKMKSLIREFDEFCNEFGLKNFYYRVPEESVAAYEELGKKSLLIGQEAIIDLKSFTLEGGAKKSIRNACNKTRESGYFPRLHMPPVREGELQKIKSVSTEWLEDTGYKELVFSQGVFDMKELREHTIITVENHEEKIVAFLNLVPDYAPGEVTFDLIRKTRDAPGGVVDFLVTETINYLQSRGYRYFNMGFAPMSGIDHGRDFPEKSIKFAYEKIGSFAHYKGLRDFKDKFGPEWKNRYIIYDHHYDLFNLPSVLGKVIKP
jgi:phosphatidylglycerol lysyltransferase